MKKLLFILISVLVSQNVFSQKVQVDSFYKFQHKETNSTYGAVDSQLTQNFGWFKDSTTYIFDTLNNSVLAIYTENGKKEVINMTIISKSEDTDAKSYNYISSNGYFGDLVFTKNLKGNRDMFLVRYNDFNGNIVVMYTYLN